MKSKNYQLRQQRNRERNKLRKYAEDIFKHATLWPYTKNQISHRLINAKIQQIIDLPYKWEEKDLINAWAALRKFKEQLKLQDRNPATLKLENLLSLILADSAAKPLDKTVAVADALQFVATELVNNPPAEPSDTAILCYLAETQPRFLPDWFCDAATDYLIRRLTCDDIKKFSTILQNKLKKLNV